MKSVDRGVSMRVTKSRWDHGWQLHDFAAWDDPAIEHSRPSVPADGFTRTLRKVATPTPSLGQDEMPSYGRAI